MPRRTTKFTPIITCLPTGKIGAFLFVMRHRYSPDHYRGARGRCANLVSIVTLHFISRCYCKCMFQNILLCTLFFFKQLELLRKQGKGFSVKRTYSDLTNTVAMSFRRISNIGFPTVSGKLIS
jgi:hypothetical protein